MTFPHDETLALRENTEIKLQAELQSQERRINKLQRIRAARRAAELLRQEIQAMRLPFSAMTDGERAAFLAETKERIRHRSIVYPFTSRGLTL